MAAPIITENIALISSNKTVMEQKISSEELKEKYSLKHLDLNFDVLSENTETIKNENIEEKTLLSQTNANYIENVLFGHIIIDCTDVVLDSSNQFDFNKPIVTESIKDTLVEVLPTKKYLLTCPIVSDHTDAILDTTIASKVNNFILDEPIKIKLLQETFPINEEQNSIQSSIFDGQYEDAVSILEQNKIVTEQKVAQDSVLEQIGIQDIQEVVELSTLGQSEIYDEYMSYTEDNNDTTDNEAIYSVDHLALNLNNSTLSLTSVENPVNNYLYHKLNSNSTDKDVQDAIKQAHLASSNIQHQISQEALELHHFIKNSFNYEYIITLPKEERIRLSNKALEHLTSAFNSKPEEPFTALEEAAVAALIYLFMPNYK